MWLLISIIRMRCLFDDARGFVLTLLWYTHSSLSRAAPTCVFVLTEWYRTSIISNRGNLLVYLILTFSNIGKSYKTRNPNYLWLRCTIYIYLFTLYVCSRTAPSKGQFQHYTRLLEKAEENFDLIWHAVFLYILRKK